MGTTTSSVSTVTATPKAAVKAVEGEDTACTKVLKAYLAELAASWATSSQQHVMKSDLSRNECFYCKKTFGCRSALFNHLRSEKHFSLGVSAPNTFSRYAPSDLEKTKAKAKTKATEQPTVTAMTAGTARRRPKPPLRQRSPR